MQYSIVLHYFVLLNNYDCGRFVEIWVRDSNTAELVAELATIIGSLVLGQLLLVYSAVLANKY